MARIRTVKPELWVDEKLTECSLSARLLFIGTFNFADDNGNMVASSKRLKMQIFPADDIDVQPLIDELIAQGLLIEYSVNGKNYWNIKGFKKHQKINRPSNSDIPQPPLSDDSVSDHGEIIDGREGKGREGNKPPLPPRGGSGDVVEPEGFAEFWELYPRKTGKGDARKRWRKLKPSRELRGKIIFAVREQSRSEQWTKQNGQFIPLPATWLNQERWDDEPEPTKPSGGFQC